MRSAAAQPRRAAPAAGAARPRRRPAAACPPRAAAPAAPAAPDLSVAPLLPTEPAATRTTASAFAPATARSLLPFPLLPLALSHATAVSQPAIPSAAPQVANLGPGFDFLGVAVEGRGDVVTATLRRDLPGGTVLISSSSGDGGRLSLVASENCCGIAASAALRLLNVSTCGVSLACYKGLPLGSGLGSSAASAAAAAWAVNLLFGAPLTRAQLVPAGLASEAAVSGYHADNIAPALMGGFVLISAYKPALALSPLAYGGAAEGLWFALVTPEFEAPTRAMRAALPTAVPMAVHVANAAQGAALVAAVLRGDAGALGAALGGGDTIVEPARGPLIPGFAAVKAAAGAAGALGCTISGAGPTAVAVAGSRAAAGAAAAAMAEAFRAAGLGVAYAGAAQLCAGGARECDEPGGRAGADGGGGGAEGAHFRLDV